MQLTQRQSLSRTYSLVIVKSFLIWCFTLTVCLLVVGFPIGVLMATVGALLTIILQSVVPASAVLLVTTGIVGVNVVVVILGAAILTLKGIHPEEVTWLHWLHGKANPVHTSVYASCPLTCQLTQQ